MWDNGFLYFLPPDFSRNQFDMPLPAKWVSYETKKGGTAEESVPYMGAVFLFSPVRPSYKCFAGLAPGRRFSWKGLAGYGPSNFFIKEGVDELRFLCRS